MGQFWGWFRRLVFVEPVRILYIGNSLTYLESGGGKDGAVLNDIPGFVSSLSDRRIVDGVVCENGACLRDHLELGRWKVVLESARWNYVVLQEHSERIKSEATAVRRDIERFLGAIRSTGARVSIVCGPGAGSLPLFRELETNPDVLIAPVAQAWELAARMNPKLVLTASDGLHFSPLGSYLSACVIYSTLFREAAPKEAVERFQLFEHAQLLVEGLPEASVEDLRRLRELAWDTVRARIEPPIARRDGTPAEKAGAKPGASAKPLA